MQPASMTSRSRRGLSAVRPEMSAIRGPSGFGTSATDLQKATPFGPVSAAQAANVAPGGESAPGPRNHGSTTALRDAEGVSPSSICLAWYHPMPRLGTPAPTQITSHVASAATMLPDRLNAALGRAGDSRKDAWPATSSASILEQGRGAVSQAGCRTKRRAGDLSLRLITGHAAGSSLFWKKISCNIIEEHILGRK